MVVTMELKFFTTQMRESQGFLASVYLNIPVTRVM